MAEPVQTDKEQKRLIRMAETISKALPYMRRHNDATFVVKYGGHAMTDPKLGDLVARDVVLMKQVGMNPIVVHGGGPQINKMLERVGLKSTFVNGLRVTDAATMEIVEMVLAGSINKAIVADINECGGIAVGICGKDGNLILARKVTEMRDPKTGELLKVDLKQVGEPAKINVMVLEQLRRADVIPVVAPIGFGVDDELTYNINADTSAGAIAGAMRAKRLLFLTDVPGVLDKDGQLIGEMTVEQARALIADGTISGGMIPKVENCIDAVNSRRRGRHHPGRAGAPCPAAGGLHRGRPRHHGEARPGLETPDFIAYLGTMALLPILTAPDPRLKKKSKPVETVDADVRRLMDDMLETMYAAPGIGLAAPQVGELRRVIVLDIDREDVKTGPLFMANPEIVEASDEDVSYEEGCLSVPDHYSDVVRPAKVTVRYLDRDGKQQDMTCEGLLATCVQHEIDHLDGVLFIDHISALKRNMILRKLLKARKEKERDEAEGKPAKDKAKDAEHAL